MSTSVSPSNAPSKFDSRQNAKKSSDRAVKVLIVAIATVVVLVVGFFVIFVQGSVRGTEFSPTHFQQRDFHFYEIPLIQLQITPIRRSVSTPSTANFLRQKSVIKPPKGQPAFWHLVSISRGIGAATAADAQLLIDQIRMEQDGDLYWEKWSTDHPQSAAVLWPIVQKLAERELYVLLPKMFEIAQGDLSPRELQVNFDSYLISQYTSLIKDMVAADRVAIARQLVDEAKTDYPDAAPWQSFLANANP